MLYFILFLLFSIFGSVVGYTWYRLHKALHVRTTLDNKTPSDYELPYEPVAFTAKDGVKLAGWYIRREKPKAVIIMVHGRAIKNGGKSTMLSLSKELYNSGYSLFLFDLRGYGEGNGGIVGFGSKEWQDVVGAYSYVRSLSENSGVKVGFLGISLGGAISLTAAGKERIGDFVIASTPYYSQRSLFAYQVEKEQVFPKFIFRWAMQIAACIEIGSGYYLYNASTYISSIKSPIFLIGAIKDTVVNPKDAWKLFGKANKPKEYWEAESSHDVFGDKKEEFLGKVLTFLSTYVS